MKAALVIGALLAILAVAAIGSWRATSAMDGVVLGFHGTLALIIGVVATFVIGAGLMALVFYSHRRGYDDRVKGDDEREE